MIPFRLDELIDWLGEELIQVHPQISPVESLQSVIVKGISTDSRKIKPGEVFIALRGERFDGHDFCTEAVSKGAIMLVVSEEGYRKLPSSLSDYPKAIVKDTLRALGNIAKGYRRTYLTDIKVIAVTGSIGKTSTKEWLKLVGEKIGLKIVASPKSYNNEIGVPLTLLEGDNTFQYLLLEFGARNEGDISYLDEIAQPEVGIVRSIAPVHLETFKSQVNIAKEKFSLLRGVLDRSGLAVAPQTERKWAKKISDFFPGLLSSVKWLKFPRFSLNLDRHNLSSELRAKFKLPSGKKLSLELTLPYLLPRFQVQNLFLALSTWDLISYQINDELTSEVLLSSKLPEMRANTFRSGNTLVIDDTYNSSPYALREALNFLTSLNPNMGGLVIGDMLELGSYSKRYHRWIGKLILRVPNLRYIWLYGSEVKETFDFLSERLRGISLSLYPEERYDELEESVLEAVRSDEVDTLLLKASRGMRLDRLASKLRQ